MLRGINRNDIFLDEIDLMKMEKILRSLAKPIDKNGNPKPPICKIYAYCLMTNHIHLLIAELDEPIGKVMKRLGVAYVSYFNKRHKRTGPLFEGRFRSEPVDESDYFTTLLHYIHYNPVKAGMTKKPGWYKWSSWHEYELPDDSIAITSCISEQNIPFMNLTRTQVRDIVLNSEEPKNFISKIDKKHLENDEAEEILKSLVPEEYKGIELKDLPKIVKLSISTKAEDFGITYTQLISYFGINKSAIYRARVKMTRSVQTYS